MKLELESRSTLETMGNEDETCFILKDVGIRVSALITHSVEGKTRKYIDNDSIEGQLYNYKDLANTIDGDTIQSAALYFILLNSKASASEADILVNILVKTMLSVDFQNIHTR